MRSQLFLTSLTIALAFPAASSAQDKPEIQPAKLDAKAYDHFGTGITIGDKPMSLSDALKDPQKLAGKTVRLEARSPPCARPMVAG